MNDKEKSPSCHKRSNKTPSYDYIRQGYIDFLSDLYLIFIYIEYFNGGSTGLFLHPITQIMMNMNH